MTKHSLIRLSLILACVAVPLTQIAVTDMNAMSFLSIAANNQFPYPVTRQNLFRGQFVPGDGNVQGPYVSQFMVQPTFYGSQLLSQQHQTFLPEGGGGSNFMTSVAEYQLVENGGNSGRSLAFDPTFRYHRNGRDLAAYTHVDVLYQGYFVAFLVLAGIGAPPNPGNPYIGSQTQKGFGTLGGPDAAATIAEMATRALKASWYHKWIKDLRMRPEEYGALVHARKTGSSAIPQAAAALHGDVVKSAVLPIINANYGSYLLPQPFPEGAPTHPCYPTGHGTVGGACIHCAEIFLRRQPEDSAAANERGARRVRAKHRWTVSQHPHGTRQEQSGHQRGIEQASLQCLVWSWNSRRHTLPQLDLLVHPTR
jgi:hypothetical protein